MAVLQRSELESSPLADLHAIASELGLEGFRTKRREELIAAILATQGAEEPAPPPADGDEPEPDEVPSEEALEPAAFAGEDEDEAETVDDEAEPLVDEGETDVVEEEPEVVEEEVSDEEISTGVLDILTNGSGFLRLDPAGQSRDDVYVSPAQIRRCELRAGDDVSGPVRPPRRNERHPSLVRVETVNGAEAEPPEERPWFGDLTPVFPSERLAAPAAFDSAPYGKGSRVAVGGSPGAGASLLLLELARILADQYPDMSLQVVLAGVRPEEVGLWRDAGHSVVGGSFERSPEAQAQAAELAVERAKRLVERGADAVVVIDALDALPPGVRRRLFGAARATEEGGTLTVLAATGEDREMLRWATTRLVLEDRGPSGTLAVERLA
ncbi:MAG TPA: Rho termination factor N-terminal domain-containing protein [Thermoleophilaceae bacterium]|nr:Rho termination factor N-terminal domain-containing protein [Thermoleophilaceae bacterium]